jgi:hypothetical protein
MLTVSTQQQPTPLTASTPLLQVSAPTVAFGWVRLVVHDSNRAAWSYLMLTPSSN